MPRHDIAQHGEKHDYTFFKSHRKTRHLSSSRQKKEAKTKTSTIRNEKGRK